MSPDKIAQIGMFEHVGVKHYRAFFGKCRELLTEDGVMLMHTIGRLGGPGRSAPALPRQSPATTSTTPANGPNASGVAAISQRG
jgi:cyclopropane fatty-acyl-phospholipid synthase-like methyltransferase